jgi:hypothetical protein
MSEEEKVISLDGVKVRQEGKRTAFICEEPEDPSKPSVCDVLAGLLKGSEEIVTRTVPRKK